MAGKVAFITGGARGLGREIAIALAEAGHRLDLVDVLVDRLVATAAKLRTAGHEVIAREVDVSVRQQCFDAVTDCVGRFGELAVLVNCAAVIRMEHFTDTSEEAWNRIVPVNLSGPFFLCQAAIPHLLETRGVIVNMASAAGIKGQAYTLPYSVTKAAVVSLTKCLALEYGKRGLRVVAVAPGGVKTALTAQTKFPEGADMGLIHKMMPLSPLAEPEEIAAAVAYLASDEARFVNGAVLAIDGAQTAG